MAQIALVVDDSMLIRHTICRFLEEHGFAVESATNGIEAIEVLKRVSLSLIITDMQMPMMTGGELITVLKNEPSTANIPVIIVTGSSRRAEEEDPRANFVIHKDIEIREQLAVALRQLFGKPSTSRASAAN